MERRVFLAIFLSFIVLVVYQTYFAPSPPPPPQSTAASPTPNPSAVAGTSPTPAAQAAPVVGTTPPSPAANIAAPTATNAGRDIVVTTDSVRAVFSTQGATLKSWKLTRYLNAAGEPLELVPQDLPPGSFPRPFSLSADDEATTKTLANAVFDPSAEALSLTAESGTLTFQYRDGAGLAARKSFYFQPAGQSFVINVEAAVDRGGTPQAFTIHFGPAIGLGYDPTGATRWPEQALHFLDGSATRLGTADVQAQGVYEGAIKWAGVEEQYFLAAAIPKADRTRVEYAPVKLPVPGGPQGLERTFITFAVRPNPGTAPSQAVTVPFFLGPKDFDSLSAADKELVRAIDFGMFRAIVTPLLRALKWINGYVGNYGWSIIVLTILINVALFPLRHRSMVSMKKMQALQPQVKTIQERYAKLKITDPERQKMNSEMMALYKQKGVNPASGCLPMLLTFPILLALYSLLSVAIELRGAPFMGWIHDLSSKDPTYVWPILMGGTMFWQQKMMPTNADPMQQKIFLLLPFVFTFMFLTMPSGLVIYWLTSNLLTIAQQYVTNRLTGAPAAAVARKA